MLYTKEMIYEIENKKLLEKIMIFYALAIPNIVGFLGRVILNLTDLIMIGTLGTLSVAGSGLAIFVTSIVGDFLIAIGSPVLTLTARRFGEGKSEESGFILTEAIVFSLKIGIPLSILGAVFSPFIMQLVNSNPGIISEGNKYLVVRNAGWFILMIYYAFQGYYNGIGRPNAYLINISIITVVNVVLNWLLIYGIGIFPKMGIMGASLATVISLAIGVIIFIIQLKWKNKIPNALKLNPDKAVRKEIRKKILPLFISVGIQQASVILGFSIFVILSGYLSAGTLAVTTVLMQLANVFILASSAYGRAGGTMLGHALGANKPDNAYKRGLEAGWIGMISLTIFLMLLVIIPEQILGFFIIDPVIIKNASMLVRVLGAGLIFDVFASVLMQELILAGLIRPIIIWNLIGMWIIFIPLALIGAFVLKWDLWGLFTPLFIYRIFTGIVFVIYYYKKNWLKIKL